MLYRLPPSGEPPKDLRKKGAENGIPGRKRKGKEAE